MAARDSDQQVVVLMASMVLDSSTENQGIINLLAQRGIFLSLFVISVELGQGSRDPRKKGFDRPRKTPSETCGQGAHLLMSNQQKTVLFTTI